MHVAAKPARAGAAAMPGPLTPRADADSSNYFDAKKKGSRAKLQLRVGQMGLQVFKSDRLQDTCAPASAACAPRVAAACSLRQPPACTEGREPR